tara:strand:+ start:8668 stop:12417 length:3750 start_codon:yes stop_codon:yes gene_type:complete
MAKFSKPSVTPGRVQPVINATADKDNRLFNWKPQERIEDKTVVDPKFTIDPDARDAEVTSEIDRETNKFAAENLEGDLSVPLDIFQEAVVDEDISVDATSPAAAIEIEDSRVTPMTTRLQELKLSTAADKVVSGSLVRADSLGEILNTKVKTSVSPFFQAEAETEGFAPALEAERERKRNVEPLKSWQKATTVDNTAVNAKNIFFNPNILNAGKPDPDTGFTRIDPGFGVVASMIVENFLHSDMVASSPDAIIENDVYDTIESMPTFNPEQFKGIVAESLAKPLAIKKSKDNLKLGQEVFREWRRIQSEAIGEPTDSYLEDQSKITPQSFTLLGDILKEAYAEANPEILFRTDKDSDIGAIDFVLTPVGRQVLQNQANAVKGLFKSQEKRPALAPPNNKAAGERANTFRPITSVMKPSVVKEIMSNRVSEAARNLSNIPNVVDKTKGDFSIVFGLHALLKADRNTDGTSDLYSDMFEIGQARLREFIKGKEVYKADLAVELAKDSPNPRIVQMLELTIRMYNPQKLQTLEAQKTINQIDAIIRYGDVATYNRYVVQALTGRLHIDEDIWDYQAHKSVRAVLSSGVPYRFPAGKDTRLEKLWKEIIATKILNDPVLDNDIRTKKGIETLSPEYRVDAFNRLKNQRDSSYYTAVEIGKTLSEIEKDLPVSFSKDAISKLANATSEQEVRQLREQLRQMPEFNADPLGTNSNIKEILAKHGKEFPMFIQYYMDLYRYDKALNDKTSKPFTTSITVEIDGVTHGNTTNAALIGVPEMAKRGGLIRTQNYYARDEIDLRDAMAEDMRTTINSSVGASLVKDGELPLMASILELAIADRDMYLKKSPMTMGYGQNIESLKQHVESVVQVGPQSDNIQKLIKDQLPPSNNDAGNPLMYQQKEQETINFLHTMLVNSIFNLLDEATIETSKVLKGMGLLSQITNMPLTFTNALGFESVASGKETIMVDKEGRQMQTQTGVDFAGLKQITTQYYGANVQGSAVRQGLGPGGFNPRIIATLVQSYDGNMVASTLSGASLKRLNEKAKLNGSTRGAFIKPIFDAYLTDLGSFSQLRIETNKNLKDGIINHNALVDVMRNWYPDTTAEFVKLHNNDRTLNFKEARDEGESGVGELKGLGYLFKPAVKRSGRQGEQINLVNALSAVFEVSRSDTAETANEFKERVDTAAQTAATKIEKRIKADLGLNLRTANTITGKQWIRIVKIITQEIDLTKRSLNVARKAEDFGKQLARDPSTVLNIDL